MIRYRYNTYCRPIFRVDKLEAAGFVEQLTGKGSHRQFIHPSTNKVLTVAVHTRKDVGKASSGAF
jgi:predicted RNA binding protein YcfA (HicA-like mRNA interferase family)